MTVIRAPSDDEIETEAAGSNTAVPKAFKRSVRYIRKVLGLKSARRRRSKGLRNFRPSRNPFFNFLRHLQVELKGMSASEVAVEGGRRWAFMTDSDKEPYRRMARTAPATRRPLGRTARARLTSSRRRRGRSQSKGARRRRRRRGGSRGMSRSRKPRREPVWDEALSSPQ